MHRFWDWVAIAGAMSLVIVAGVLAVLALLPRTTYGTHANAPPTTVPLPEIGGAPRALQDDDAGVR